MQTPLKKFTPLSQQPPLKFEILSIDPKGEGAYYSKLTYTKDNDTIDMGIINKKLQDMSRNRRFLISEVEKIVKVTFTFTSHRSWALLNRFKQMTTTLVLPGLIKFIQGLNGFKWFELNDFYEKNPCKKKRFA